MIPDPPRSLHITRAMLDEIECDMATQHIQHGILAGIPSTSNTGQTTSTVTYADLLAIARKLDDDRRKRESQVFMFPGTFEDFRQAADKAGIKAMPPSLFPSISDLLFGLEVRETGFPHGPRITLIGESNTLDKIDRDPIQLAKAVVTAYPEKYSKPTKDIP